MSSLNNMIDFIKEDRHKMYVDIQQLESLKKIKLNELKNMDFYSFLDKLQSIDKKEKADLFLLYFLINEKPILYNKKTMDYTLYIERFINKIVHFKHKQLFLITMNDNVIRKIKPLFLQNDKICSDSKELFKDVMRNTKSGDSFSLIMKDKSYIQNSFEYYPLFLQMMELSQSFQIEFVDFFVVNNDSYQKLHIRRNFIG